MTTPHSFELSPKHERTARRVVIVSAIAAFIIFGIRLSFTVFFAEFVAAEGWSREAAAAIVGVPKITKTVDAWDASGPKPYMLYASNRSPFKALPVAAIRLKVGNHQATKKVKPGDTQILFNVPLDKTEYEVKAEMLNARQKVIAGAYYVYCRRAKTPV